MENGMERKFRYGIWKMPEWNGMEDFKNGMEDNLPYFHTNSILDFVHFLQKNTYRYRVVIKNYVSETFNFNIFVDKLRYLGRLYCKNSVLIASLQVHCSLQH